MYRYYFLLRKYNALAGTQALLQQNSELTFNAIKEKKIML